MMCCGTRESGAPGLRVRARCLVVERNLREMNEMGARARCRIFTPTKHRQKPGGTSRRVFLQLVATSLAQVISRTPAPGECGSDLEVWRKHGIQPSVAHPACYRHCRRGSGIARRREAAFAQIPNKTLVCCSEGSPAGFDSRNLRPASISPPPRSPSTTASSNSSAAARRSSRASPSGTCRRTARCTFHLRHGVRVPRPTSSSRRVNSTRTTCCSRSAHARPEPGVPQGVPGVVPVLHRHGPRQADHEGRRSIRTP